MSDVRLELAGWLMCLFGCIALVGNIYFPVVMSGIENVLVFICFTLFALTTGAFIGANWDMIYGSD